METSKIAMVTISILALIGAVFAVLLSTNVINLDKITAVGGENKLTIVYPNDNESAVKWTDLSDGEVAQFLGVIDGTLDLDESDIACVVVADGVTYELTLKYLVDESGNASYSGETYASKNDNNIHFCFSILNG